MITIISPRPRAHPLGSVEDGPMYPKPQGPHPEISMVRKHQAAPRSRMFRGGGTVGEQPRRFMKKIRKKILRMKGGVM